MKKWLALAIAAFFIQGLGLIFSRYLSVGGDPTTLAAYIAIMFAIAGVIAFAAGGLKHSPRFVPSALLGFVGGLLCFTANYSLICSLTANPSYVVMPSVLGGNILLVAILSAVIFKEKLTPRSVLALTAGLISIILLSLA